MHHGKFCMVLLMSAANDCTVRFKCPQKGIMSLKQLVSLIAQGECRSILSVCIWARSTCSFMCFVQPAAGCARIVSPTKGQMVFTDSINMLPSEHTGAMGSAIGLLMRCAML